MAVNAGCLSTMLFMVNMLFMMLVLDCLVGVYGVRVEDRSEYQNCIADPSTCTSLYAARPPPGQRVRACDALSVAEWAGGGCGGTQDPGGSRAHRHHPYGDGAVDEPGHLVRFLPPSTLLVALNDGGY